MEILGLDLGTNSIGWAVVEKEDKTFNLVDKGVRIFQEGVKIEKGIESSKAAERTEHRSARRIKYRRKLRKIETLKVLSKYEYCPQISVTDLNQWRYKKVYPQNEEFRKWLLTDDEKEKHPYYFRYLAISSKLDLENQLDRYKLGRAFYHMAQRRGFLSNRLESTPENESGKVLGSIRKLQERKKGRTLGQYFYEDCYREGIKIRDQYTHREEDYLEEFERISEFQNVPAEVINKLKRAIFYQRPLRSQKGLIGKCVFETKKPRCAASRPEFEEYRMLCFVNSIKIKSPGEEKLRPLTAEERAKVIPRFFLQRDHFDFEDVAKQLAPKKKYKYFKARNINPDDWLLNYSIKTTVSGCPISARFKELFGNAFMSDDFAFIRDDQGRSPKLITDAWHALYTFNSDEKLASFAKNQLRFDDEQIRTFLKISLKQDFASLSLKAINKILPYLREGLIYSHAVFLANMDEALPKRIWQEDDNKHIIRDEVKEIIENQNDEKTIINIVNGFINNARRNDEVWSEQAKEVFFDELDKKIVSSFGKSKFHSFSEAKQHKLIALAHDLLPKNMVKNFGKGEHIKPKRIDEAIKAFLADNFGEIDAEKIYHPSAIETYKPAKRGEDGLLYLGSPMTSSVHNPMAMRALHQLRKVVNELIREGIVDSDTKINIEMSRGLLNANERVGLKRWQENREKKRKEYSAKIKEFFSEDYQPSDEEILKYQLWEEQKHKCLYTGNEIALNEFLGADPQYDIEHTIPRSLSYDNSQVNKTLCENQFNRSVKKNSIPFELSNHSEILSRIEHWENEVEALEKQIAGVVRQAKSAADKEQKDRAIQRRHELSLERNYWKSKCRRFTMKEVPEGFKNSQIVDIGIITKYARLYLKTVFERVYTVKGNTVADFRIIWGLQNQYEKKARINHVHHCIDAVTIACMDKSNYETLAKYYHDSEDAFLLRNEAKPSVDKPWDTFTEDVLNIENEVIVSHYTPDNLPKQSKKKLRKRGKIVPDKHGKPIYQQGDSVRGSLHKDTFYGAVSKEVENKKGEKEQQIKYVVRKSLDGLEDSNLKNIVDDRVREIATNARKEEKQLLKQIDTLVKKRKTAEEHEEIELEKEIEEIKLKIKALYVLPNKNGSPVPIKKVRLYQPTITNPLLIKKQRDISSKGKKEHKEHYYAANDGNYMMAIYEGIDPKGKIIRDFQLVNNMDAGEYYKLSVQKALAGQGFDKSEGLFPKLKTVKGLEIGLRAILKTGTMVILYRDKDEAVIDDITMLRNRLYKVIKMNKDGRITLKHHQVAANDDTLKQIYEKEAGEKPPKSLTNGESKVDFEKVAPKLLLSPSSFDFFIEGVDFRISPLGKIIKIG
jgi:CRISPR-associated endonuclease Csn1